MSRQSYDPVRAAFFVSWDPNSLASLKKHYKDIDLLIPRTAPCRLGRWRTDHRGLWSADNTPPKPRPPEAISNTEGRQAAPVDEIAQPAVELPTMGLINNYDGVEWRIKENGPDVCESCCAAEARAGYHLSMPSNRNEAGIVVDFEEVPDASQAHFRQFIATLAPELHSAGLKLMIALPARDDAYDYYEFFGNQCDAIVVMNYDQHWLTSPPGPIAAQDWFVENLRQVFDVVPPQKGHRRNCELCLRLALKFQKIERKPRRSSASRKPLLHVEESDYRCRIRQQFAEPHYSLL